MAFNPSPHVADCREIARKWGVQQVVIVGISTRKGTFEVSSFGETKSLCDDARKLNQSIFRMLETGEHEIDMDAYELANMKAAFLREWEGLKFLCLNGRGNSLTFASQDHVTTGHDALLLFYFNGQKWIVSLYHAAHRTNLDLSEIAKRHGGGGHRGACGFQCSSMEFITNDIHHQ